ncbi:B12-binding domain-containing radical SAM protein [Arcobacter ellisii]|uniref:B12-binding domain-containing radical SAM protein n=1 Tax=Arcobacter ellisii TaxID=913109 RepID=A0A347U9B0_9BACT|nr:B12-binding domain-containing radical SAM protein [Arcobacter ellisii]AXX95438.1 radical SAM domain/B12 binding domain-containing protein (DUF4080 domain) [Arcobacter ellisii]RXI29912.1 B12-binding domain-containing radical SAM protein [Arcobacter ellisii]
MKNIILTTLNARYSHTSLALRYLYANLKELKENAKILEFVINSSNQTIAEQILEHKPKIVGIAVYIWNATDVAELVQTIKKVSPETIVVLGGPEVSYKPLRVNFDMADYIITGEGEVSFYNLCKDILNGNCKEPRVINSPKVDLENIILPYDDYTDFDIKNRHIYVEMARGCPFECEFCLSSIDTKMRYLSIEVFLEQIDKLWQRGARNFKFIDRTFNIKISYAKAILNYFLEKEEEYFLHFEVIPDNFPEELRELIKKFKAGSLQLEVGIQTLNLDVAKEIHRNLRIDKIKDNLKFLSQETHAHMHIDLIIGLPSETIESFGKNLDLLYTLSTGEIQVGILKKLSGTTLDRHDKVYGMVYSDLPPYDILKNDLISFEQMQEMKRFARFWDIVYNSGNFQKTTALLFENGKVFENFYDLSKWLYRRSESTYKISLDRMAEFLFEYMSAKFDKEKIANIILEDVMKVGGRKIPPFLKKIIPENYDFAQKDVSKANKRQELRKE